MGTWLSSKAILQKDIQLSHAILLLSRCISPKMYSVLHIPQFPHCLSLKEFQLFELKGVMLIAFKFFKNFQLFFLKFFSLYNIIK